MNAKDALEATLEDYGLAKDYSEVVQRALRLLAAAERNDGSTPETDALVEQNKPLDNFEAHNAMLGHALTLECERNGLAARVGELEPDAGRYRWILHQAAITDFIFKFLKSNERHVSNAIDAAIEGAK